MTGTLSCGGQGVHDLTVAPVPIAVIHGHVDRAALDRTDPEAPLLGALVWAGLPAGNVVCLKYSDPNPPIRPACPDPYGVFPGEVGNAVPIDAQGNFEFTLNRLPVGRVSVGDARSRIAYGSLIVFEDTNQDGRLTLPTPRDFWREDDVVDPTPDTILGASFHSLHAAQERIVLREGEFVAPSNFYPAPACASPPVGFSVMSTSAFRDEAPKNGTCTFSAVDKPVTVTPLSRTEGQQLACRPKQQTTLFRRPPDREDEAVAPKRHCLSRDIAVSIETSGACTLLSGLSLRGCVDDPFCVNPAWNRTSMPPTWWPCQ